MKILFVLTYYRPHWTGLTRYAARLAEGLSQKGHQVKVLSIQHQKNLPQKEIIKKVQVIRVPFWFRFSRGFFSPLLFLKFWSLLLQNEAVAIYLPFPEVLPFAIMAKIAQKKLFLIHNGDVVLPQKGGLLSRIMEKIYYLTTSAAINLAEAVIVQTRDYSQHSKLLSKFKKKWKVILPLYPKMKINHEKIKRFKKKHHLMEKKLVGFSGRFVEEKGVDYLLRAIPKVIAEVPNAYFVFAGEYKIPYEKFWREIKSLIEKNKDHLLLLGLIKNKEKLAGFYSSLNILVQPSKTDCFPSSLVEAVLLGIPVVSSNIPGARWVVEKTKMGVLVSSRNHQALAQGIITILKNRKKYLRSKEKIEKVFNYQKTIREYETLFTSFLEKKGKRKNHLQINNQTES